MTRNYLSISRKRNQIYHFVMRKDHFPEVVLSPHELFLEAQKDEVGDFCFCLFNLGITNRGELHGTPPPL